VLTISGGPEINRKVIDLQLGLSYDDVLLAPGYTNFTRDDVDISTRLTKKIKLKAPFVSSPMDTVTDSKFAIALAKEGGFGILHRNLRIAEQAAEVATVKKQGYLVGAAVGVGEGYQERVAVLVKAGVDAICIDTAHGYTNLVLAAIQQTKRDYPDVQVIAGSIATYEAAKALIDAGADGLRVGMGPASICTTRIVSGMGVPQLTAVLETVRAGQAAGVPVIADGGITYIGDMVKAFAAGASSVMVGGLFAATTEAAGETVELSRDEVPPQFRSLLKSGAAKYQFKVYRGMGSVGAMKKGAHINAEDEFHGKSFKDKVLVAEGVEGLVPVRGSLKDFCDQAVGGIRSGMFYIGAKTLPELYQKAQFIRLTAASLRESHPHDVHVTNAGKSYR
jgi:IMP dehydrogenase